MYPRDFTLSYQNNKIPLFWNNSFKNIIDFPLNYIFVKYGETFLVKCSETFFVMCSRCFCEMWWDVFGEMWWDVSVDMVRRFGQLYFHLIQYIWCIIVWLSWRKDITTRFYLNMFVSLCQHTTTSSLNILLCPFRGISIKSNMITKYIIMFISWCQHKIQHDHQIYYYVRFVMSA